MTTQLMHATSRYSADWTSAHTAFWHKLFAYLEWPGKPNLRFLEVGAFEGRSTVWFLEHVLTDPTSRIDCVDTFEGSEEHAVMTPGALEAGLYPTFKANVCSYGASVCTYIARSDQFLRGQSRPCYEFVYLDGSHRASDVLTDAVLAWPLIKPDGVLLFDDNGWRYTVPETGEVLEPKRGIDAFRVAFQEQYELLADGIQVAVRKR